MRRTSQIAIVGAILAMAGAFVRNNGNYDRIGLAFLAIVLALIVAASSNIEIPFLEQHGKVFLRAAVAVVIIIESSLFFVQPIFSETMPRWIAGATAASLCACGLVAISCPANSRKVITWIIVGIVLVFGVLTLRTHDDFYVDVRLFQDIGAQALLHGVDPYAARYPNPYPTTAFYGTDNVDAQGWLKVGFMYPPLIAILGIPGAILGDVRYSHVLAMTGAAAALGFARPGRMAVASVAIFALMPRMVYFLAGGWSEPISILLLCGTVWAACRPAPRTAGVVGGLLIASKQYLVVAAPLLWLLGSGRDRIRIIGAALIAAVGVTVPFALWHPTRFFDSISFQLRQPVRKDALSFLAALAGNSGTERAHAVGLVVIIIIIVLALFLAVRTAKTPAGFALSVALVVVGLFAFSQQAFLNYYVLAFAALCAALATSPGLADNTEPAGLTNRTEV
jgi:hypothetical protein